MSRRKYSNQWCRHHQTFRWCEHNGGVLKPSGNFGPPKRSNVLGRYLFNGPAEFRMFADPPTKRYHPVRMWQLFGGRKWSVSFCKIGDMQRQPDDRGCPCDDDASRHLSTCPWAGTLRSR